MALQGTSDSSSSLSFPSPPAPLHLPPGWDEECQSLNGNHFLSEVVPSGRGSAAEPGVVSGRTGLDSADEFDTGASIYASHRPDFNIHISSIHNYTIYDFNYNINCYKWNYNTWRYFIGVYLRILGILKLYIFVFWSFNDPCKSFECKTKTKEILSRGC